MSLFKKYYTTKLSINAVALLSFHLATNLFQIRKIEANAKRSRFGRRLGKIGSGIDLFGERDSVIARSRFVEGVKLIIFEKISSI